MAPSTTTCTVRRRNKDLTRTLYSRACTCASFGNPRPQCPSQSNPVLLRKFGRRSQQHMRLGPPGMSEADSILGMRSAGLRPWSPGVEVTGERRLPLIIQLGGPCGQETRNAGGAVVVVGGVITCAAVVPKPGKMLLLQGLTTSIWQPVQGLI